MSSSSVVPKVKHLVLEVRYAPTLLFYTVMDRIGVDFSKHYPDWERTPLSLELRNKKAKRRCFMTSRRTFYEALNFGTEATEFDRGAKLFDRLHTDLRFTEVLRIGIRQWACVSTEESYANLVAKFSARFQADPDRIQSLLRGRTQDVGYIFDVRMEVGWNYRLQFGPMERKQWFEVIPHDLAMFDSTDDFTAYQQTFPERFFFVDIDAYKENVTYSELSDVMSGIQRDTAGIIEDLISYLRG